MQELNVQTDKHIIPNLPRFTFGGRIVVIQSIGEAQRAVDFLRRHEIVGIDTETRPSFRREISYKVSLLQVSTEKICFLFRLNHIGLPQCICDLFEDINVIKVGLSLRDDFRMLSALSPIEPRNYIELQTLSAEMGIKDLSLQKLFANVFGKRISKTAQLTNWEADVLSDSQKVYAATDAYTCILLYQRLHHLRTTRSYTLVAPPVVAPATQDTSAGQEPAPAEQNDTTESITPTPARKRASKKKTFYKSKKNKSHASNNTPSRKG